MSLKAMAWAWEQQGLTLAEKLILVAIADHSSDDGWCFPSLKHLMSKTGISSQRYCRQVVSNLIVKERLAKKSRHKDGRQMSNLYKLNFNYVVYLGGGSIQPGGGGFIEPGGGGFIQPPIEPSVNNHQKEPSKGEASPSSDNQENAMLGGSKKPSKGSKPITSDALKGSLSDQKEKPTLDQLLGEFAGKTLTGAILSQFWRRVIASCCPEYGPVHELKQKEVGHLVQLRKYLKDDTLLTIATVVTLWIEFTKYAEANFGAYKSPMLPQLPYMVLHSQAMASFCHEPYDLQSIAKNEQKCHSIAKEKPVLVEKEKEKPMTLDEFNEIHDGGLKPEGD